MDTKLNYNVDFSIITCEDDRILPNKYHVVINLITVDENSSYQNIALERIIFFIKEIFENSLLISLEHPKLEDIVNIWNPNHLAIFPEDPIDHIIGIILYHKLSAIIEEHLIIDNIVIKSDLSKVGYTVDDFSEFEQCDCENCRDIIPWWNRSDISTTDFDQITQAISWKEIDLDWNRPEISDDEEKLDVEFDPEVEQPEIVVLDGGNNKELPTNDK
jgi:hypothetical protein